MEMTITVGSVEMRVEFEITQYIEETMYDRFGEPGSPAEGGEIYDLLVFVNDVEVSDIISEKTFDKIDELIYEQL
jgi:hypothetical protein